MYCGTYLLPQLELIWFNFLINRSILRLIRNGYEMLISIIFNPPFPANNSKLELEN